MPPSALAVLLLVPAVAGALAGESGRVDAALPALPGACPLPRLPAPPLFTGFPKQAVLAEECRELNGTLDLAAQLGPAALAALGAVVHGTTVELPVAELGNLTLLLAGAAAGSIATQQAAANFLLDDVAPNGTATMPPALTNQRALNVTYAWEDCFLGLDYATLNGLADPLGQPRGVESKLCTTSPDRIRSALLVVVRPDGMADLVDEGRVQGADFRFRLGPTAPDGVYGFYTKLTDVAGNVEADRAPDSTTLLDTTPPRATAELRGAPGPTGWFTTPAVDVALACSDAGSGCASIAYQLDGVAGSAAGSAATLLHEAGDGAHVLTYHGVDKAGNVQGTQWLNWSKDAQPPVSSVVLAGPAGSGGWFTGPVTATLSCTDPAPGSGCARVVAALDVGAAGEATEVRIRGEGRHSLVFHAEDRAGNAESPAHVQAVDIDSQPPVTTVTVEGTWQGGFFRGNATVRFACDDGPGSGCAATTFQLDGGAAATGSSLGIATSGTHTVAYWSRDAAGNVEEQRTLTVPVDATPPTTTIALDGPAGTNGWFLGAVDASFTCADGSAGSGCAATAASLDGAPFAAAGRVEVSGDGRHTLAAHSTDHAGNVGPDATRAVDIDGAPPSTDAALSGARGAHGWYTSAVRVTFACTDAVSGCAATESGLDGAELAAAGSVENVTDGKHVLAFRSTDLAGNVEALRNVTFDVDTLPPTTSFTTTGTTGRLGWYTSPLRVDFTCDDGDAARASGCDGAPRIAVDARDEVAADNVTLSDGAHSVAYHSTDVAGNAEAARSHAFLVDTQPPRTTLTLAGPAGLHGWYTGPVRASFACTDAVSGCDQVPADRTLSAEGTTTLSFRSTDVAGNAEAEQVRNVSIDSVAPVVSIASPRDGQTAPAAFTLRFDVAEANKFAVRCFDDATEVSCGGGAWPLQFASDGDHTLTVQATDDAGNTGAASVRVHVSTEKPSIGFRLGAPVTASGWAAAPQNVTVSLLPIASQPSLCVAWDDAALLGNASSCQAGNSVQLTAPEGVHVLYAQGSGDGRDYPRANLTVRTDGTAPRAALQLSPAEPDASGWFRQGVAAHLACSDDGSGVDACALAGGPAPGADLALGDGVWFLTARVTDQVGHAAADLARTVQVDTKPPELVLDAPEVGKDPALPVRWSARDEVSGLASVRLERVEGSGARLLSSDAAGTLALALDPGASAVLRLTAADRSGQQATLTRTVTRAPADAVLTRSGNGTLIVASPSAPVAVRIAPGSASVRAGDTLLFSAVALDAQGRAAPDRVAFVVEDASIGSIAPDGTFLGLRAGSTRVVASAAGLNASAAVRVTPGAPARLVVSPAAAVLGPGGTLDLDARGLDAQGNDLGEVPVAWQVRGSGSVDAAGRFTAGAAGTAVVTATAGALAQQVTVSVTDAQAKAGRPTDVATSVVHGSAGSGSATGYAAGLSAGEADAELRLVPPATPAALAAPLQDATLKLQQPVKDFAVVLTMQPGSAATPPEVDPGALLSTLGRIGAGSTTGLYLSVQASEAGRPLDAQRLNQVLGGLDVRFRLDASFFDAHGLDPASARLVEFSGGKLERDDVPARLLSPAPVDGQYLFGAQLGHFSSFAIAWVPRNALSLLVNPEPPCTAARGPITAAAGATVSIPLYDVSPRLSALTFDVTSPLDAAGIRVRVGDGGDACPGQGLPALPPGYVPILHLDADLGSRAAAVGPGRLSYQLRADELAGGTAFDVQTLRLAGAGWVTLDTAVHEGPGATRFTAQLASIPGSYVIAVARGTEAVTQTSLGACSASEVHPLAPADGAAVNDAQPALVVAFPKTCALGSLSIDGAALAGDAFTLRPDGGVQARPALAEGAHRVALQLAGQAAPVTWQFIVDRTPPVLGAPEPAEGSRAASAAPMLRVPVADALSGVDAAAVRMTLDGAPVPVTLRDGVASFTPGKDLAPGMHRVRVEAGDNAGNTAVREWSFQVPGRTPFPAPAAVLVLALGAALAASRRRR